MGKEELPKNVIPLRPNQDNLLTPEEKLLHAIFEPERLQRPTPLERKLELVRDPTEEEIAQTNANQYLLKALLRIPPEQRQLHILFAQGLSIDDIAKTMGKSIDELEDLLKIPPEED